MTKVKAQCVCEKCGKSFVKESAAFNSRQAAEKKEWIESQDWLCPECYKAKKEAELTEKVKKYNLPELEGTEKQIKFASDLRKWFIRDYGKMIDKVIAFENAAKEPENIESVKKQLKVDEITSEEIVEKLIEQENFSDDLKKARAILTETKAGKVMDILKWR